MLNKKQATKLAKEIISNITNVTTSECPAGSGYFTLTKYDYTLNNGEPITLQLVIEVCEYENNLDKHHYYGIYYIPEINDGDNIGDSDWEYTKHCNVNELAHILILLEITFSKDYLWQLYQDTINPDADIRSEIQITSEELKELLKKYCKNKNMKKPDFVELTIMLLDYWLLDDDLSTACAHSNLITSIEDKIIELGKSYDT